MREPVERVHLYEELAHRLVAALRAVQLYEAGHPLIERNIGALEAAVRALHAEVPCAVIGVIGQGLVGGDMPLPRASTSLRDFVERLTGRGIERIAIDRGVSTRELETFLRRLSAKATVPAPASGDLPLELPHVRAGRLNIEQRGTGTESNVHNVRRTYGAAVAAAEQAWESAQTEGTPDLMLCRDTIENLTESLSQNRTAMLGLTAMKHYDNYTFTHMVNVAILTIGQARALGMDGRLLRDLGMAGLMHDIGKVRTPPEILKKTTALTGNEFDIMKRHVIDGAEILKRTPEMPGVAAVVAFEHHFRPDGTGYPAGISRSAMNVATLLCSIADVYDAMRSKRAYQQAHPTDRIVAVFKGHEGHQFDQHLVRRFVQLLGIYPPGTLVKLTPGDSAGGGRTHAPYRFRPAVGGLLDANGESRPAVDVHLWEAGDGPDAVVVAGVVDPADYPFDPIALLN